MSVLAIAFQPTTGSLKQMCLLALCMALHQGLRALLSNLTAGRQDCHDCSFALRFKLDSSAFSHAAAWTLIQMLIVSVWLLPTKIPSAR